MKLQNSTIIGAVLGDIAGSVYEWDNIKSVDFSLLNENAFFTDDTVLTIAVADALLHKKSFADTIWTYGNRYPYKGYGSRFVKWLASKNPKPYKSFGNGSAMRVSPVGFACDSLEETLSIAKESAAITHNHREGIKGAHATASAIFMARTGKSKQEIKDYISKQFKYKLNFTLDEIRPHYTFDVTCQGSVPQAIVAFLESESFEHALRLAISIGGDSDTIACITGGIAAAFYRSISEPLIEYAEKKLPEEFIIILNEFDKAFHVTNFLC